MLNGFPILIAEDEILIAACLAEAIEDLGGNPVGPVATVAEGLALLATEEIGAAILDVNLLDRDITPLALSMMDRQIPFVVFTGSGLPAELAERHPDLPTLYKPAKPIEVLATLLHHVSPDRSLFAKKRIRTIEEERL